MNKITTTLCSSALCAAMSIGTAHATAYDITLPAPQNGYGGYQGRNLAPVQTQQPTRTYTKPVITPSVAPSVTPNFDEGEPEPVVDVDGYTFGGTIEGGIMYSTGNTETRDFNLAITANLASGRWEFQNKAELINREENGQQTDEEYRYDGHLRYGFDPRNYAFGEVEYVDDRFSGFDYRVTEVIGYGHKWYVGDLFRWSSEIGVGAQQTKTTTGVKSSDPLARLGNDIFWQITEYVSFENSTRADFSELITVRNSAALKSKLTDALHLKLGVDVEYLSEVPATKNETDTDVYLNVAYEY
ncbi:MAG: DUF481 domain-containing protein [Rickettsiales bacterium]|nr:DUF481 domain-containing protein [Rickettsiales bacterium]